MEDKSRECLNCGEEYIGNYCPTCGQSADVGRLTTKNFAVTLFSGLTRINKGFLYTCWRLLIAPWSVISDYIKGKRVRYTGPVQTLIVLCFISLFLSPLMGDTAAHDFIMGVNETERNLNLDSWALEAVKWYANSPTFQYLTLFIPAVPAFMLIVVRNRKPVYNLAECLLAAIYTSASMFVFSLIVTPLDYVLPFDTSWLTYPDILVVGTIGIIKALRRFDLTRRRLICRIVAFYALSVINYIVTFSLVAVLILVFVVNPNVK